MKSTSVLKTARLLLTPLQVSDSPKLFPHCEVVRYLDSRVPWPYLDDGALTYVRDTALLAITAGRDWHRIICLALDPEQKIGSISLYDKLGNKQGFWLSLRRQGPGYMREVCEVMSAYWFETLNRSVMRVPKAMENGSSRKISRRERLPLVKTQDRHSISRYMLKDI